MFSVNEAMCASFIVKKQNDLGPAVVSRISSGLIRALCVTGEVGQEHRQMGNGEKKGRKGNV